MLSSSSALLTKDTDLQTGQPGLDLGVDVRPAKVHSNGLGFHFKLLLCGEKQAVNDDTHTQNKQQCTLDKKSTAATPLDWV